MIRLTRHPMAYSLVFGFVLLATLSLAATLHSLWMTSVLSGDAGAINIAGSLRMQSYRIAYELKKQPASAEIEGLLTEFENRLNALVDITDKHLSRNQALITELEAIRDSYGQMKQVAGSEPEAFFADVDSFVNQIDAYVESLELWTEEKVTELHNQQMAAILFTLVVALVFTSLIYRRLVVPLQNLVNTVVQIGQGDSSARAKVTHNDEFGQLSKTLNLMAEEISQNQLQLEQKIAEQTDELSRNNQILEFLFSLSKRLSAYSPDIAGIKQESVITLTDICHEKKLYWQSEHPGERTSQFFWVYCEADDTYLVCDAKHPIEPWKQQIFETMSDLFENAERRLSTLGNEKRIALQEERNSIARELHDSIAQNLSYLKIQVVRFSKQQKMGVDQAVLDATLQELREGLNSSYRKLRELLVTFRTQHDDLDFRQAIKAIIEDFSRQSEDCRVEIQMDDDWPERLDAQHEVNCLHIIREALTNAYKHASATVIQVRLRCREGRLIVLVCDDGIGFATQPNKPEHYGLQIMAERAERIGGQMSYCNCSELGGACAKLEFNLLQNTLNGSEHG